MIPPQRLFKAATEPGAEDTQRTPKLLAVTMELRDLDDDTALKDAEFPFTDLTRLGRGMLESMEGISGLGHCGRFVCHHL